MGIKVKRITRYSNALLKDLNAVYLQLTSSGKQITPVYLKKVLRDKNVHVYGLYDSNVLIGTGTVIHMQPIGGSRAYVDDVIVDAVYRGRGLGRKLMNELLKVAKKLEVKRMEFTSRPERAAANALYHKMGFEIKETNVFQMKFERNKK